jgi:hypothetical protein
MPLHPREREGEEGNVTLRYCCLNEQRLHSQPTLSQKQKQQNASKSHRECGDSLTDLSKRQRKWIFLHECGLRSRRCSRERRHMDISAADPNTHSMCMCCGIRKRRERERMRGRGRGRKMKEPVKRRSSLSGW